MSNEIELSLLDEHVGHGVLAVDDTRIEVCAARLWRVRNSDEIWNFEAYFPLSDSTLDWGVVRRLTKAAAFEGIVGLSRSVQIGSFVTASLWPGSRCLFRAKASQIQLGCEVIPFAPESIQLVAELTRAEAIPDRFGSEWFAEDGQIRGGSERPAQVLSTALGRTTLQEESSFESPRSALAAVDVRFRRPVARLEVASDALTRNIVPLVQAYQRELDTLCLLLGFLGRQTVAWLHIEVLVAGAFTPEYLHDVPEFSRIQTVLSVPEIGALVSQYALPPDALNEMVKTLAGSPNRTALELAMSYVVAATRGSLEARIINSFTALESLVNAGSRKKDQRPIRQRVATLLTNTGVDWKDLWPDGVTLEDGLHAAFNVRNSFVHEGAVSDRENATRQQMRIRSLTERVLYQLLGGRREWLHDFAYRHESFRPLTAYV